MKILFAIKTLVLPGGGAERVLAVVTSALAERGHEILVASFDAPGEPTFYALDARVRHVPLGLGDIRANSRFGESLSRIASLRRLARRELPHVAVGFMHSAYLPLGIALLGTDIPLVASEHIAYVHYRDRPLQAVALRLTPWLAQCITVISPAIRDGFPRPLRRRMEVVPNPVEAAPAGRADVAGEGKPVHTLLAIGRLEAQKGHCVLIEAFARIASDFPTWRLRIVGEGELRGALETQVQRLQLGDRVALPGATDRVGAEYAAAQLFAMPSAYESFGLTTAEALGHGLPVVGFADCAGTNELVRDGINGRLVSGPDRVAALSQGLAALMASPDRRVVLGDAGPRSIEGFAPAKIVDVWETLLSRVGRSTGRARTSRERA